MGGCRCTYRNCTVKTDGKTHMFHYPVFEKVRCHQWLVNAQRLEFLELKVSQLKNRVVCQHHFREENFMNYKKDKLTFDAIPTENGPFCDPSKFLDQSQEKAKSYPNLILLEDIENEVIFNDKKANFSLKYGDFLTNGELMDSSTRYNLENITFTNENTKTNAKPKFGLKSNKESPKQELFKPRFTRLSLPSKDENKIQPQPMLVVPPYTDLSIGIGNIKEVNQEQITMNIYEPNSSNNQLQNYNNLSVVQLSSDSHQISNEIIMKKEPKVKILSEKKVQIQSPLPIIGKLKKVSPSITLNIPDKNTEESMDVRKCMKTRSVKNPSEKLKVLEVLDVEFDGQHQKHEPLPLPVINEPLSVINEPLLVINEPLPVINAPLPEAPKQNTSEININNTIVYSPSKNAQIKNKITSERSAAIEKKRKFNMRMKDILETCLDKLDDSIKTTEETPSPVKTSNKSLIKQPLPKVTDTQVAAHLATEESLPSSEKYTIAYLDARIKSMERALLNKIEQNSQRIIELKDTFVNVKKSKEPSEKKYISAETNTNEDCYKKFLYKEISQYLSPDSNSLIYEELFINKYAVVHTSPLRKRRRKCI